MAVEHKHILMNARVSNSLSNPDDAITFLTYLVDKIGMKILMGPYATYVEAPGNRGTTAIVGIETSHIAFHIWDEEEPARLQFDLYTCGALDVDLVLETLKNYFGIVEADYKIYDRAEGFQLMRDGIVS